MTIGERIRQLRLDKGLTQLELALKVGYKSRSSVNKIEVGERDITQSTIVSFAKALDTTPSVIMGWSGDVEQSYSNISLSTHETNVITAYRDKPDMQPAVDKLLGVAEEERKPKVYRLPTAARSTSGTEPGYAELTEEQLKKLRAAKGTDNL